MILGYKRGQRVQPHKVSLIKIEGVNTIDDARYYFGKRVAYVYKAKRATKNKMTGKDTRYRVIVCPLEDLYRLLIPCFCSIPIFASVSVLFSFCLVFHFEITHLSLPAPVLFPCSVLSLCCPKRFILTFLISISYALPQWGRVMRSHGNGGTVRVNFASNLPPHTIAASCRVVCATCGMNAECR